jgi:hypothetical protein
MAWQKILTAPFDRDIQLAVIDRDGTPHALVFQPAACSAAGLGPEATSDSLFIRRTGGIGPKQRTSGAAADYVRARLRSCVHCRAALLCSQQVLPLPPPTAVTAFPISLNKGTEHDQAEQRNCELNVDELNMVVGGGASLIDAARVIGGITLVDTAVENAIAAMHANQAGQCSGSGSGSGK